MRIIRHLSPPTASLRETGSAAARAAVAVLGGAGLLAVGAVAVPATASPTGTRATAAASTATTHPTTATYTEHTTGTTTSGGKVTCSWAPAYASSVLATAIYFHVTDMSNCLSPGPSSATIAVYATWADAQARTNSVGSATAMWGLDGAVTGLTPETDYWWVSSDNPGAARGPVHTLKALPTSSTTTTTTTRGPACTPAPSEPVSATSTSISFLRHTSADCPSSQPLTITVYARRADADARKRPVGTVSGMPGVVLTVDGLKPNRQYWYVSTDAGYARGPVKTLRVKSSTSSTSSTSSAAPSCTASYRVVQAWSGGFVAEVAVTATTPITGWRLMMNTATGDTIEQAWGAKVTPSSVFWTSTGSNTLPPSGLLAYSAINLPGAGALAASETYRWGVLGSITPGVTPSTMSVTCIAS